MTRPSFVKAETYMRIADIVRLTPSYDEQYQVKENTLCGPVWGFVDRAILAPIIFPTKED